MTCKLFLCFVGVTVLGVGLSSAQGIPSRCSTMLQYGGVCIDRRQGCQQGTYEYPYFSNFLGCGRADQVCCAYSPQQGGPGPNPGASIQAPPPLNCGMGSGTLRSRILNGRITAPCDWPFVVSIRGMIRGRNVLSYGNTLHSCGGVLVADNWVLTSPFCVLSAGSTPEMAPNTILVVAGEYNVSGVDIDPLTGGQQEQLIQVERAFIHPNYPFRNLQDVVPLTDSAGINSNAVALLQLRQPITGRCSGVACLPSPDEASNACASYDNCVIAGWGYATESLNADQLVQTLMVGENQLSSRVACDFLSRRLNLEQSRPAGTTCQGPKDTVTDSCLGDEGGAVMCNTNGRNWVVRGILPFNICVNDQYNMFVTDVAPYMPWISQTMAQNDLNL